MAGGRTAFMVVVSEAEPAVAHLRLELDPVARLRCSGACYRLISVQAGVGDPAAKPDNDTHANQACMVDAHVAVGCGCRERIRGALSGFSFAVGISHAAATVEIGDPSTEQR
jgi:hypothetical protein